MADKLLPPLGDFNRPIFSDKRRAAAHNRSGAERGAAPPAAGPDSAAASPASPAGSAVAPAVTAHGPAGSPGVAAQGSVARPIMGRPVRQGRRLGLQVQLLLFGLVIMAGVGLAAYYFLRPAETRYLLDSYQYATVTQRPFRELIVGTGTVTPDTVVVYSARVDARVAAVHVEPGEDVVRGQVLVELVSDELNDRIEAARAELERARLDMEQARLTREAEVAARRREWEEATQALVQAEAELPKIEALFALGGVSEAELTRAREAVERERARVERAAEALALAEQQAALALELAQQQVANLERQLQRLEEQRDALTVRADVEGRILDLPVRIGQHVERGTEVVRYADIRNQHVETTVTPEQAARLAPGAPAVLRIGSREIPAVTAFVAPQATTAQSTQGSQGRAAVPVRLAVDPAYARELWPFAEVAVEIELGVRPDRPALPRGPYFTTGDASFVYVISADGRTAERRDVRYGAVDGQMIEVVDGLAPGDRIIYSSYAAFRTHRSIDLVPEGGRPVHAP
ncbi:MAG TPA: HlyD family efflux transporter periplasmic adaptor subunit [Limnochordales bacterium]